jgi:hypothetical protein
LVIKDLAASWNDIFTVRLVPSPSLGIQFMHNAKAPLNKAWGSFHCNKWLIHLTNTNIQTSHKCSKPLLLL